MATKKTVTVKKRPKSKPLPQPYDGTKANWKSVFMAALLNSTPYVLELLYELARVPAEEQEMVLDTSAVKQLTKNLELVP